MKINELSDKHVSAIIAQHVMGWRVVHYVGSEMVEGFVHLFNHNYISPDCKVRNDVKSEYSFWSPAFRIQDAFEMQEAIDKNGDFLLFSHYLMLTVSGYDTKNDYFDKWTETERWAALVKADSKSRAIAALKMLAQKKIVDLEW